MTAKEIIQKLVDEKNYDRQQTERLEARIDALSPEVRASLENWLETGSLESPEYAGYTVQTILQKHPYKEIGAFIMLDWLKKKPEDALKSLNAPFVRRV